MRGYFDKPSKRLGSGFFLLLPVLWALRHSDLKKDQPAFPTSQHSIDPFLQHLFADPGQLVRCIPGVCLSSLRLRNPDLLQAGTRYPVSRGLWRRPAAVAVITTTTTAVETRPLLRSLQTSYRPHQHRLLHLRPVRHLISDP